MSDVRVGDMVASVQVEHPLVLSAGDWTRVCEWAAAAGVDADEGATTPDAMLLRQITAWLHPAVWLIEPKSTLREDRP